MKEPRTPYIQFPPKKSPNSDYFYGPDPGTQPTHQRRRHVVAAVKRVFNSHTVRFAHSLTPVRLVAGGRTLKSGVRTRR